MKCIKKIAETGVRTGDLWFSNPFVLRSGTCGMRTRGHIESHQFQCVQERYQEFQDVRGHLTEEKITKIVRIFTYVKRQLTRNFDA